MGRYREFPNDQQGLPPFTFHEVGIRSFAVPASLADLEGYCEGLLNFPGVSHFTPAAPLVYLGINSYGDMESANPEAAGFGEIRQNEYWVMFPAIRHNFHASGFMLPFELTWVFPFIGVDNASSAFTGQEVLGFQKQLGKISYEAAADGRFQSKVSVPGFLGTGSTEKQRLLPLMTIETGTPFQVETPSVLDLWLGGSGSGLTEAFSATARTLMKTLVPGSNSVTNLKQIRDAQYPDNAAYQALVRCEWEISNPRDVLVYGADTRIEIFDSLQLPVATGLGLGQHADGTLKTLMGFGMTCDMAFDNITRTIVH